MRDIGNETGFHMIYFPHLIHFHILELEIGIYPLPFDKKSPVPADQEQKNKPID